jgi:hypothetical protein
MRSVFLGLILTILTSLLLRFQGSELITSVTPLGIINLEFCDSKSQLAEILFSWRDTVAKWNIALDFLFIFSYGTFFFTGCKLLYQRARSSSFTRFTSAMLIFCFLPPSLDILENILMLLTLNSLQVDFTLAITPLLAGAKFITAAIVVLYLLVSLPLNYAFSKKTAISK